MLEVNSETDFVAKDDNFRAFVERVADAVATRASRERRGAAAPPRSTDEPSRTCALELVTKVGENISVRRFDVIESRATVGAYVHGTRKIGVLVEIEGGTAELARDLAMQVASLAPRYVA